MPRLDDRELSRKVSHKVIYINGLLMQFEDTTLVSANADDLAIACSGESIIDMTKKLQKEVDKVVKWSDDARLTLDTNKCEVSFFTLFTAEASRQPHIAIRGLPFSFNAAPTFLGVQYDRQLTFSEHTKKVCQAMTKKTNILRALGGTTWKWRPAEPTSPFKDLWPNMVHRPGLPGYRNST